MLSVNFTAYSAVLMEIYSIAMPDLLALSAASSQLRSKNAANGLYARFCQ